MKSLITKQVGNEAVYNFKDARVIDKSDIHVTFQSFSDTGTLFASTEARESLQSFLEAKSDCDGLTVTWLPQKGEVPEKEMRTVLGVKQTQVMQRSLARQSNEMIVQPHCSDKDLDYVTGQLRSFSR
jgi:hypothetical protein